MVVNGKHSFIHSNIHPFIYHSLETSTAIASKQSQEANHSLHCHHHSLSHWISSSRIPLLRHSRRRYQVQYLAFDSAQPPYRYRRLPDDVPELSVHISHLFSSAE